MVHISPQKSPSKKKRYPPKQEEYIAVDKPSAFCPKCRKSVKEEGVVCNGCHAYWHYKCADVTQAILDEEWKDKDFMCKEHENRGIAVRESSSQGPPLTPASLPTPRGTTLIIATKINSYTLNQSTGLKKLLSSLNQKLKVTPRDNGQQYHVKLCPPTYRILVANIEMFGKQWGITFKGSDLDNNCSTVKTKFSMELHTKSGYLALTSVNFQCTTTSLHFQLNKASQSQPGWHEKKDCLSYFVNSILSNAVTQIENTDDFLKLHDLMKTELTRAIEEGRKGGTKKGTPSSTAQPQTSQQTLQKEIHLLVEEGRITTPEEEGTSTLGVPKSPSSCINSVDKPKPAPDMRSGGEESSHAAHESTPQINTEINAKIEQQGIDDPHVLPQESSSAAEKVQEILEDTDTAPLAVSHSVSVPAANQDMAVKVSDVAAVSNLNDQEISEVTSCEEGNPPPFRSPQKESKSPRRRKGKKCTEDCERIKTTLNGRINILEKERNTYKQKSETLETHQETLRETIKSQKALIHEQQISAQIHSSLAMMFMDEIVDDGESITPQEQEGKIAQMKQAHEVNKDLQKQLDDLKVVNAELTGAAETQKQEEKRLVKQIKSLETSNAELSSTGEALKKSIHSSNCTIECLKKKIEEENSTIATLYGRIRELEEMPAKEVLDEESSVTAKEIYDLQVNIAYLEKSKQDLELEVTRSHDQITQMQDVWTEDKNRLIRTESMYSDVQLKLKNLTQELGETQAQLAEVQSLNAMREEVKAAELPLQTPTGGDLSPQTLTREENEHESARSMHEGIERLSDPDKSTKGGRELCLYELLEPGKCRRKEKCKFCHTILPHMREETWINTKVNQMSNIKGRCVREMVQKGSCPKRNECNHPHIKDQPSSVKKICFREIEKLGSCPRGENCRFSHNISDTERESPELQRQANLHKNSSHLICVNEYRQEHSCHKRDKCRFRHDISDKERKSASLQEKMKQRWEKITSRPDPENKSTDETGKLEFPKPFMEEFRMFMIEMRALASRPGGCP